MNRNKPPLRWRSGDGLYRVIISRHTLTRMSQMAKVHLPNEVGTSLVGSYSDNGSTAFVLDIAPLPGDSKATPVSFIRGIRGMKEFFERVTKRFKSKRFYIGEWHSHPFSDTDSSATDKWTHRDIAQDKNTSCAEVIMLVLGGDFEKHRSLSVSVHSCLRGLVQLRPDN